MDVLSCAWHSCWYKCELNRNWLWFYTRRLFEYVINFYEVFLFFILDWLIIAAVLEVLFVAFPDTYDSPDFYSYNFKNYFKSLFSVFVFFTTNNSPELLMKNYPENAQITTFFVTLIWFNNIILIGLLIGLSYYKMKRLMHREVEHAYEVPAKAFVFEQMIEKPNANQELVKAILLLHLNDKSVSQDEIKRRINAQSQEIPEITRASEDIFWKLRQSFEYELIFSIINLIIVIIALQVIHARDFSKYHHFIIVIGLCCLSLFDFLNNIFFFDMTLIDKLWKTIFDTILNFLIIGCCLFVVLSDYHTAGIVKVWAFLCLAKQFRFFLLLFKFNRQRMRSHIIYPYGRYLYDVTGLIIVLFIIFGTLVLNLFGGNVHTFTSILYNEQLKTEYEYEYLNFNSLINSLISLFVVVLNNNWPILANMGVIGDIQKKQIMKFVFIVFKLLINYILINSLIAFTIQIFSEFEERQKGILLSKLDAVRPVAKDAPEPIDEDYSDVFDEEESEDEKSYIPPVG